MGKYLPIPPHIRAPLDIKENRWKPGIRMTYPKGFMATYVMTFGHDSPSFCRYMGKKATLTAEGGEGMPRYELEEKGNYEEDPDVGKERKSSFVLLPGVKEPPPG